MFARHVGLAPHVGLVRAWGIAVASRGRAAVLERGFARIAIGLGFLAWSCLLLAELGWLSGGTLLVATIGACALGCRLQLGGAGSSKSPGSAEWLSVGGLLLLLAVAVALFPAWETVLWAGDSTVYLAFAERIADSGGLLFEDALLGAIPVTVRRDVFRNRTPLDTTGAHARFPGGFLIPDIRRAEVTAGFSPLFPVLLAAAALAPGDGMFLVAPAFAVLALVAVFLLGRRLGDGRSGALAAAIAAVCLPQLWYARFSVPEMVAQLFFLAGVLLLLLARDHRAGFRVFALAGGCLLGLAAMAKVDLAVLGSVSLVAFAGWALASRGRFPRVLGWLLAGFSAVLAHLLVHYAFFPSHYADYVARRVEAALPWRGVGPGMLDLGGAATLVAIGLVAGLAVLAAVVRLRGARFPAGWRATGIVVLLGSVAAYLCVYFGSTEYRGMDAVRWLGSYLSWPVLGLALVGTAGTLRRSTRAWRMALLPIAALVVCAHYLYDPLAGGEPLWDVRRFVPVVVPAVAVLAAVAAVELVDRLPSRARAWGFGAASVAIIAAVGASSLPLLGLRAWAGASEATSRLARLFPEDAVVLVGPGLAGTHVATSLAYREGVDAVQIQAGAAGKAEGLDPLVRHLRSEGRPIYLLLEGERFSPFVPTIRLRPVHRGELAVTTLGTAAEGEPIGPVDRAVAVDVYRAAPRPPGPRIAIDVGDPTDDLVFGLSGFHAAEREAGGVRTFRWTGPTASLQVPAFVAARLWLAAPRLPGLARPEVSVAVNGEVVLAALRLPDIPVRVDIPAPPRDSVGPVEIAIASDSFVPREHGVSSDSRALGVQLFGVELEIGSTGSRLP